MGEWDGRSRAGVGETLVSVASADSNPTGTGNVTIPMSVTLTSPGTDATWMVTIGADIQISTGGTTNLIELLVDGTPDALTLITQATTATVRLGGAKTWVLTGLSAGSHTLTARTRNTAGSTSALIRMVHTVMTSLRTI